MPTGLPRRQSGGETTIDHECRIGNPAGLIGSEVEERVRDFGGLADAAQGVRGIDRRSARHSAKRDPPSAI